MPTRVFETLACLIFVAAYFTLATTAMTCPSVSGGVDASSRVRNDALVDVLAFFVLGFWFFRQDYFEFEKVHGWK